MGISKIYGVDLANISKINGVPIANVSMVDGVALAVVSTLSYTTNLASAWSTQRVVISGYTGNLVRLRRSSDNAESDFGFITGTGDIDNASITTWLSGATAFYVKIYDQNGTNHYGQTVLTKQPERVGNRAYSNGTKMLLLTNTFSNEYNTIIDASEGLKSVDRNIMGDTVPSAPYKGLMFQMLTNSHGKNYYYYGDGSGLGYYNIVQTGVAPEKVISYTGVGGHKDINIVGFNNSIIRDTTPTSMGYPSTYFTNVKPSFMYDGSLYGRAFTGYLDERYLYLELLNTTNLGTVKTFINDKYTIY